MLSQEGRGLKVPSDTLTTSSLWLVTGGAPLLDRRHCRRPETERRWAQGSQQRGRNGLSSLEQKHHHLQKKPQKRGPVGRSERMKGLT